jgi:hypothetical protein
MNNATRLTVSTFGAVAALAGMEHGIGEVLQGNVAPDGVMILSWPESEFFGILAGEPAMTIIPNLLVTGLLAILVSLAFLALTTMFIGRKHAELVLILLSIVLLLVGGGFGPPILGIIVGLTATRIGAPLTWWRTHGSGGFGRMVEELWPWSFGAALAAWLLLMPGLSILDYFFSVLIPDGAVYMTALAAFGLLLTTIVTALAHDAQARSSLQRTTSLAMSG